jgi:hypothetical protein
MQIGDREKKFIGYFVLVVAVLIASYLGAYNGTPPLPPLPEQYGAESIPNLPGPPGDFVSRSQGGQYNDAIKVVAPTANATADAALYVNNQSVAESLRVEESGTPVFVVDGGSFSGVIGYGTTGQQLVCGTTAITGTGTAVHGLTTPAYCMATLKDDFGADGGFVSCAISGATVTLKQWKINATPTAGSETDVNVAWCVIGTP